ncbi:MAG: c-type cytochrome [Chlorobiales bacterium]|nr:c-type cytochrome [Chlorobiales bacterium]
MHDTEEPQESHNKIPKGWMLFFVGGIIFLVGYIVSYTPAISGWSFYQIFEKEMADAAKTKPQTSVTHYSGNKEAIADGNTIFASNCAPCHKADATGGIGPNLTGTLKYGSTQAALHESISTGRPNGMPPFLQQLGSDRIDKVISFLETLRKK